METNLSTLQFLHAVEIAKGREREDLISDWTSLIYKSLSSWFTYVVNKWVQAGLKSFLINEQIDYTEWAQLIKEDSKKKDYLSSILSSFLDKVILKEDKTLEKVLFNLHFDTYERGAKSALRSMGFITKALATAEFTLEDKAIIKALEDRANSMSSKVRNNVVASAQAEIVNEVFIKGGSVNTVIDNIKNTGVPFWKSKQVAETEFQSALAGARHEMFKRSGVKLKRWISVGDRRVRPQHRANEGQGWIEFDQLYQNGARHPGDGPSSINCRCVEEAELSDPSILLDPWDGS